MQVINRFDPGFIPVPDSINYSSASASGERRLYLPRIAISEFMLNTSILLTDAGPAAGEGFDDYQESIKIIGVRKGVEYDLFHVQTGELAEMIKLASGSAGTGRSYEPSTYTGDGSTENLGFWNIPFAHDFSLYDNVYLSFQSLAAASAWASATAVSIRLGVLLKSDARAAGSTMVIRRFTSPTSSTLHQNIAITDDMAVGALYFQLSTGTPKRVTFIGPNGAFKPAYGDLFSSRAGSWAYMEHIESASLTATKALYPGLNIAGVDKSLEIEMSAAGTITVGYIFGALMLPTK